MQNLNNPYKDFTYYMKPSSTKSKPIVHEKPIDRYDVINTFRRLWFEHIMWTRAVITATAFDNPDKEQAAKRLLQNPADFGNVMMPLFDKEMIDKFEKLFTEHLTIAGDLLTAHRAKELTKALATREKWYKNAAELATHMEKMNPYWPKNEFSELLNMHLKLTEEEMLETLSGDYTKSIAVFDAIEAEALRMSDLMALGLIKQFSL